MAIYSSGQRAQLLSVAVFALRLAGFLILLAFVLTMLTFQPGDTLKDAIERTLQRFEAMR